MPLQSRKSASSRVAIRYGHCKLYCDPKDVCDVTARLALQENPFQNHNMRSCSAPNDGIDNQVVACADALRLRIAKATGSDDTTLHRAIGSLRKSGVSQGLLRKIGKLNHVASFLRHLTPAYLASLESELDTCLTMTSFRSDACEDLPPVPPPPLEEPSLNPHAPEFQPLEPLLGQQRLLIDAQNAVIGNLVSAQNKFLANNMANVAASLDGLTSIVRGSFGTLGPLGDDVAVKFSLKFRDMFQGESGPYVGSRAPWKNGSAVVDACTQCPQLSMKKYRFLRTSQACGPCFVATGVQTFEIHKTDASVQFEALPDSCAISICSGISEESVESESSSQFVPDEIIEPSELLVDAFIPCVSQSGAQSASSTTHARLDTKDVCDSVFLANSTADLRCDVGPSFDDSSIDDCLTAVPFTIKYENAFYLQRVRVLSGNAHFHGLVIDIEAGRDTGRLHFKVKYDDGDAEHVLESRLMLVDSPS